VKPAPGSFHSSVQSATGNKDETFALVIDQLRLLRNTFCHSADAEITKADFDHYVKLVQNALTAVKLDTSFVDVIGKMNEDDFPTEKVQEFQECRIKELQSNSMFQESILSSIEQQTEKIDNMEKKFLEKVESLGNKAVSGKLIINFRKFTIHIHTVCNVKALPEWTILFTCKHLIQTIKPCDCMLMLICIC
jgi:N-acyl-D-aspartate/D-glutamate deacylase